MDLKLISTIIIICLTYKSMYSQRHDDYSSSAILSIWLMRVNAVEYIENEECAQTIILNGGGNQEPIFQIGTSWTFEVEEYPFPIYTTHQTFTITDTTEIESNHYKALAIDLSRINGKHIISMDSTQLQLVEKLQNCLEDYGGIRENFGPFFKHKLRNEWKVKDHKDHIHFSVNSYHTCTFDYETITCDP